MKKLQITDFRVQQAVELYKSGKAIKPICQELKMDGEALRNVLISLEELRTRSEAVRGGKSDATINDDALKELTPDALYWIGFLYADGHIEKGRNRVTLTLSAPDKNHLHKCGDFFGKGLVIRQVSGKVLKSNGYVSDDAYRVGFSSVHVYKKLEELGFTHNKTYTINSPHPDLVGSRDFWRGVIDGDGWVSTKVWTVGVCGAKTTIEAFSDFIKSGGIETKTSARLSSKRSTHLYSMELHHHKAVQVLNLLYKDAPVYLDRKYQKYLEIMAAQK